jgi:carboxypeptidase C (cathepsin A)
MTRVAALSVCFLMISTVAPVAQPANSYSTTSHAVRIEGRDIKYTATAGTLPLKDTSGKEGFTPEPPFRLVDNEQSALDVTDLVFSPQRNGTSDHWS